MNRTVSATAPESHRNVRNLKHLRRSLGVLASLLVGAIGFIAAAPSAFAMRVAEPPGGGIVTPAATVVHSGMLGWQIALIAVGAALVSAVVTAVLLKAGSGSRLQHATS